MSDPIPQIANARAWRVQNWPCILLASLIFALHGCVKDAEYISTPVAFEGAFLLGVDEDDSDGYVGIEFTESFDSPPNTARATFTAGFKHKEALIDAGVVSINDTLEIPILDDNRFLLYYPWESHSFQGKEIAVSLASSTGKYKSFTEVIYIPKLMQIQSNIGLGDYFYKSKDLELSWQPDENIDEAHIGICVAGLPCLWLEAPDDGFYTIPSSTFSHFPEGNFVTIVFGRGLKKCLDNGYKEVCITTKNYAFTGRLVAE